MIRKILAAVLAVALSCAPTVASAQSSAQPVLPGYLTTVGCTSGVTTCYMPYSNANPLPVAASNPSVGTIGATAPTSGTQTGGKTAAGNLVANCVATDGTLCSPQAGTANRTITHTNLTLNTSTTICPAATNPVTTEIFFTTAGVGINLQGGTLTTATVGASTTTTPNIVIGTASTLYTFPVGPSNIITAYGAAGYIVCIQTLRQ